MITIVILFMFKLGAQAAPVSPCGTFKAEWSACTKTEDCTATYNVCGAKAAYNADYLGKIDEYIRCQAPMESCVSPDLDPNREINLTLCKKQKCELLK